MTTFERHGMRAILLMSALAASAPISAFGANAVHSVRLEKDPPSLHCLGFRWFVTGDDNGNAAVAVSYRKAGEAEWRKAMPLRRVEVEAMEESKPPAGQGLFAGSIFFLASGTEYEVKLELTDPDGGGAAEQFKQRTRAEPVAPPPARTLHVAPGQGGGSGTEADPFKGLDAAEKAARPGDLVLVHKGVYDGGIKIQADGTPEEPIVWRAAGDGEAVIECDKSSPKGMAIQMYGRKHRFFEGLGFRNAAYTFHASGSSHIVVRRCSFRNVGYGYFADGKQERLFFCDNDIEGCYPWPKPKEMKGSESRGFDVSGSGHSICYNRVRHFRDGIDVRPGPVRAVDIHNNDISRCWDDAMELDGSEQNVRAYLNRITDTNMGISFQPCCGGPAYFVRNVLYNVGHETWKLHLTPVNPKETWATGPHRTSGGVMIHNTIVKSNPPFRVWSQEGPANCFYMRNNLYVGTGSSAIDVTVPLNRFDADHDLYANGEEKAWGLFAFVYKDKYATIQDFAAKTGNEKHGLTPAGIAGIFGAKVDVPDNKTRYDPPDLRLAAGSIAIDRGEVLPGINDGFAGAAPDIGAYEFGRDLPHYGPRPIGKEAETDARIGAAGVSSQ